MMVKNMHSDDSAGKYAHWQLIDSSINKVHNDIVTKEAIVCMQNKSNISINIIFGLGGKARRKLMVMHIYNPKQQCQL